MKNIIITFIIFSFISCKAQTIYNFGTPPENIIGTNYYLKDIDNHHDAIVGVWKWVNGSDSFEITLQEFEKYSYPSSSTQYSDDIFGKYKYIKNGVTITEINEILILPNFNLSLHYRTPTKYAVVIRDIISSKGKIGEFILTSPTTATLELWNSEGVKVGTETGIDFALPTSLVLTKQ